MHETADAKLLLAGEAARGRAVLVGETKLVEFERFERGFGPFFRQEAGTALTYSPFLPIYPDPKCALAARAGLGATA
jgi:hypothetical protein